MHLPFIYAFAVCSFAKCSSYVLNIWYAIHDRGSWPASVSSGDRIQIDYTDSQLLYGVSNIEFSSYCAWHYMNSPFQRDILGTSMHSQLQRVSGCGENDEEIQRRTL